MTIFAGNQECHFKLLYPSGGEAFVCSRGVLMHFPPKHRFSGLLEILGELENVIRLPRRLRDSALSLTNTPDLGELILDRPESQNHEMFHVPEELTIRLKYVTPFPCKGTIKV